MRCDCLSCRARLQREFDALVEANYGWDESHRLERYAFRETIFVPTNERTLADVWSPR